MTNNPADLPPATSSEVPGPAFSFRYQPVLGTELHVVMGCASAEAAERAQQQVLDEIVRLEALLSTYRVDTPPVEVGARRVGGGAP